MPTCRTPLSQRRPSGALPEALQKAHGMDVWIAGRPSPDLAGSCRLLLWASLPVTVSQNSTSFSPTVALQDCPKCGHNFTLDSPQQRIPGSSVPGPASQGLVGTRQEITTLRRKPNPVYQRSLCPCLLARPQYWCPLSRGQASFLQGPPLQSRQGTGTVGFPRTALRVALAHLQKPEPGCQGSVHSRLLNRKLQKQVKRESDWNALLARSSSSWTGKTKLFSRGKNRLLTLQHTKPTGTIKPGQSRAFSQLSTFPRAKQSLFSKTSPTSDPKRRAGVVDGEKSSQISEELRPHISPGGRIPGPGQGPSG